MIEKIRDYLTKNHFDALLLTRTDSFLGEHYPPESHEFYQATSFSGSAGLAIITQDQAVLFVDSRYTEQAKLETSFQVFEIPTEIIPSDWMLRYLKGKKIAYNPWYRSVLWTGLMIKKGILLTPISKWTDLFPKSSVVLPAAFSYDECYAGQSADDKIKIVQDKIQSEKLDAYLITSPDSVSYLLNQRSLAVLDYPVVFKRLIVFADGHYQEYQTPASLSGLTVGLDFSTTPQGLYDDLVKVCQIKHIPDMVAEMKCQKNAVEQDNIRQACLFESMVICQFLAWIEENKNTMTEMDCDLKLKELRAKSPLYQGDSFDTIAAVGEHAARAHYRADEKSNTAVSSASMLLVDTGGNYLNGTTDMTRTICISNPTEEMKKRYTQVLKGHIACATTVVHENDLPDEMDKRAHSFLRSDGVDYGHSTGHGIGMYLSVHEYPPAISENAKTPLKSGMLFSNEPAYYDTKAGYGIRLENMLMTLTGPNQTLMLENLLWIPFDGRLVDFHLLTSEEREWLRAYHQGIALRIMPKLSSHEQELLQPLLDFFN